MKKLLIVSTVAALGLASAAFAGGLPEEMPAAPIAVASSDTGIYLGLAGGFGMTHWKNLSKSYNISNDNGITGRAFLGYDISKYFAAELGYSYFFNSAKVITQNNAIVYNKYKTQAFDLFGKGKMPITDEFSLFAKFGVNYLISNLTAYNGGVATLSATSSPKTFNLAFGAGADYSITPNIVASLEWMRCEGKEKVNDSKYHPETDSFLIGLRYKFDL